jgi:hypothetical protein
MHKNFIFYLSYCHYFSCQQMFCFELSVQKYVNFHSCSLFTRRTKSFYEQRLFWRNRFTPCGEPIVLNSHLKTLCLIGSRNGRFRVGRSSVLSCFRPICEAPFGLVASDTPAPAARPLTEAVSSPRPPPQAPARGAPRKCFSRRRVQTKTRKVSRF